jgi:SOS-response transcriptional repressor LexA
MGDKGLTAGNKMARLGEHFRLTQEQWAEELGVSRGTIAAYKNRDNASPSSEKVRTIARRFGIPITWFYDGVDTVPPVAPDLSEAEMSAADGHVIPVHPSKLNSEMERFANNEKVALPVWRGIVAGPDFENQFTDDQLEPPVEVPGFFTSGKNPEIFIVCLPTGISMAPRIIQGDRVITRLHSHPDPNDIIIARRPDGINFIKVFRIGPEGVELHSINGQFPVISHLDQWVCKGVVVGIWKPYQTHGPNIEFNGGSPLKA